MPANGGMTTQESVFMQKMMEVFEKIAPPHAVVPTSVSDSEVADLRERLARLEAILAAQAKASTEAGRRV